MTGIPVRRMSRSDKNNGRRGLYSTYGGFFPAISFGQADSYHQFHYCLAFAMTLFQQADGLPGELSVPGMPPAGRSQHGIYGRGKPGGYCQLPGQRHRFFKDGFFFYPFPVPGQRAGFA
jgi:hypothetical protein